MPITKSSLPPGIFASGALLPLLVSTYKIYKDGQSSKITVNEIIESTHKDSIVLYCKKMKKSIFKLKEEDYINIEILFQKKFANPLYSLLKKEKKHMIERASKTAMDTTSVLATTCVTIALAVITLLPISAGIAIISGIIIALLSYPLLLIGSKLLTQKSINKFMNIEIKKEIEKSSKTKITEIEKASKNLQQEAYGKAQEPIIVDKLMTKFLNDKPTEKEVSADLMQIAKAAHNPASKAQIQVSIDTEKQKTDKLLQKIVNPNITTSKNIESTKSSSK
ncbi:membrane hypothetical protein [Candidatus Xenohaliotis californiensis]|uniref:Uncharacterized protein n=1 Tax=Candidatus Xenohaliotis californiensis TaxID=84677 RepID=A0ABP0EW03_9RICK|nr:membrane hypothetical protein [Candidatus Xenohaliotis californiensis]